MRRNVGNASRLLRLQFLIARSVSESLHGFQAPISTLPAASPRCEFRLGFRGRHRVWRFRDIRPLLAADAARRLHEGTIAAKPSISVNIAPRVDVEQVSRKPGFMGKRLCIRLSWACFTDYFTISPLRRHFMPYTEVATR
jgi:hypothetical protein